MTPAGRGKHRLPRGGGVCVGICLPRLQTRGSLLPDPGLFPDSRGTSK